MPASAAGGLPALFSATLTPPGYYRNVLGCPDARAVALESPFPPQHLGLYCLPSISTRYRDREASIRPLSDALAAMAKGKVGNYLAFFPSYAYLRQVYEDFTARYPDIPTLAQESGLDDAGGRHFWPGLRPTGKDSARLRGAGRHLRGGGRFSGGPPHRVRHRGCGPAPGEPPAGDAPPLLRRGPRRHRL